MARAHVRLVTLTGPGGTGKTRLALAIASDLALTPQPPLPPRWERGSRGSDGREGHFPDGIYFVDLVPLAAADNVLVTIVQALGVKELLARPCKRVCEHIQPKQLLLLLDNFEHLLGAAPLVADLLRAAPRLTVLATSRIGLRLSGEHEYAVPPLALPPTNDERRTTNDYERGPVVGGQSSVVGQYAAVQLFIARAGGEGGFCRDRCECGGGCRDLLPAGWAAAGDRAGGGADKAVYPCGAAGAAG
jgi:predicted ATPase